MPVPIQCEEVYPSLPYPEEEEMRREFQRTQLTEEGEECSPPLIVPFTEAQWEAIRNS